MTVHRGTMDARQLNFSTITLSWEAQSTLAGGGSTAISSVAGRVTVDAYSTAFAKNAGLLFDATGYLQIVSRRTLFPSRSTVATVSTTDGQIIPASNRGGLELVNISNAKVSFGFGDTAVINRGVTLFPGGTWSMDEYSYSTLAVRAVSDTSGSTVTIQEYLLA